MAGTLSGISCSNLSQHEGGNSNNRVNTSYNEMGKNKSAVSFNHYLSHNIKDSNPHMHEGYDGP